MRFRSCLTASAGFGWCRGLLSESVKVCLSVTVAASPANTCLPRVPRVYAWLYIAFVVPPGFVFVLVDGVVWTRVRKEHPQQGNERLFDSVESSAPAFSPCKDLVFFLFFFKILFIYA